MKPSIGRIVIYRNRHGVDMAALVTAVVDPEGEYVHLHLFPSPSAAPDRLDYQWGTRRADDDGEPAPKTWRWPTVSSNPKGES